MKLSELHTKIVATVGPSTESKPMIKKLMENGVNVFRLNFAHGSHAEHAGRIAMIREAAKEAGIQVGILQDLPGPKLRVGRLPEGRVEVKRDELVALVPKPDGSPGKRIPISYPRLAKDLKAGDSVFIADGLIRLVVQSVTGKDVRCRVTNPGIVRTGNGVNMPHSNLRLNAFTRLDREHLAFGIRQGIDFVGISFVGNAKDLKSVRAFSRRRGGNPFIIAKVERQAALNHLDEIVATADGLMAARGDLGVEVPFSDIPGLQKKIVSSARRAGKPVIVATQVLESMIQNPRPTRAEATDIANAILEGADAIMLSGETAAGKYPLESVQALREVIIATEKRAAPSGYLGSEYGASDIIAHEACDIADRLAVRLVVVPTRSGKTAERVSRFRPNMPVLALVKDVRLRRKLVLYWGVQTLPPPPAVNYHDLHTVVFNYLRRQKVVSGSDKIVFVSGDANTPVGETSMVQVLGL